MDRDVSLTPGEDATIEMEYAPIVGPRPVGWPDTDVISFLSAAPGSVENVWGRNDRADCSGSVSWLRDWYRMD